MLMRRTRVIPEAIFFIFLGFFYPPDHVSLVDKSYFFFSQKHGLFSIAFFGAGEYGMLPRDVAARLGDKRFTRFHVTNRIKQMNKRLDAILGQRVAEKRGKNWALTSFMRSAWDSAKEEINIE
jgi:hypothetical protein